MRTLLTVPLFLLLLAAPAVAQTSPSEALQNDPAVQRSQDPQPTQQGNRPPDSGMTDTKLGELTQLLTKIWAEPVDLQGHPIQVSGTLSSPPPAPADPVPTDPVPHAHPAPN